jgi:hypothetical protein
MRLARSLKRSSRIFALTISGFPKPTPPHKSLQKKFQKGNPRKKENLSGRKQDRPKMTVGQ